MQHYVAVNRKVGTNVKKGCKCTNENNVYCMEALQMPLKIVILQSIARFDSYICIYLMHIHSLI